ncbi:MULTISPECIES: pyrroline-5-carboxylate reductase [Methylocaldum]|jgi:pyrroline-5-carboxylate reductase|uniref:pyrroline-5-carboxylate reductase n=1 Tax=unclassified Methylocaldum TaxID=2622260 RepID=UPI000A3263A6|nr:pyrroline-5-carboxylate reductase [Methylocaldum sp. RMAD-M]MBP1149178.1 pyrroline-5-carboxylate reductase [Methylocaldum sp. RMAD-M]MDV3241311.1 pyrroline-5-carboxylate reductase [Methylocaldum sp.]MVF20366.1 pyrroline-5-carboxylate reductase [Methylocaldum sp. BRCS4]
MKKQTLGFIGAGNMASSLIGGLISDGYPADNIFVSDVDTAKLKDLASRFGVHTFEDNKSLVERSQTVLLAVKPQILEQVAREIAGPVRQRGPLMISIAAGVRETALDHWLGGGASIVRCMPNTPALVKTGATALHANDRASAEHRSVAEAIVRAVGIAVWVEKEELLDLVTALSGSGPAYFFLFMEAMEDAATEMGMDKATARLLTQQTALGAARIAIESEDGPAELRRRVTSPGGTTEKAIEVFERGSLRSLVLDAMKAANARAAELSKQLGG